jgi:hypothetical protein
MNPEEKNPAANPAAPAVNQQVTDAVTQSNVKVIKESPAMALGNIYQTAAQSTKILFENAVKAQHQQHMMGQAASTQGVNQIHKVDTVADAIAIAKILNP